MCVGEELGDDGGFGDDVVVVFYGRDEAALLRRRVRKWKGSEGGCFRWLFLFWWDFGVEKVWSDGSGLWEIIVLIGHMQKYMDRKRKSSMLQNLQD